MYCEDFLFSFYIFQPMGWNFVLTFTRWMAPDEEFSILLYEKPVWKIAGSRNV